MFAVFASYYSWFCCHSLSPLRLLPVFLALFVIVLEFVNCSHLDEITLILVLLANSHPFRSCFGPCLLAQCIFSLYRYLSGVLLFIAIGRSNRNASKCVCVGVLFQPLSTNGRKGSLTNNVVPDALYAFSIGHHFYKLPLAILPSFFFVACLLNNSYKDP